MKNKLIIAALLWSPLWAVGQDPGTGESGTDGTGNETESVGTESTAEAATTEAPDACDTFHNHMGEGIADVVDAIHNNKDYSPGEDRPAKSAYDHAIGAAKSLPECVAEVAWSLSHCTTSGGTGWSTSRNSAPPTGK